MLFDAGSHLAIHADVRWRNQVRILVETVYVTFGVRLAWPLSL